MPTVDEQGLHFPSGEGRAVLELARIGVGIVLACGMQPGSGPLTLPTIREGMAAIIRMRCTRQEAEDVLGLSEEAARDFVESAGRQLQEQLGSYLKLMVSAEQGIDRGKPDAGARKVSKKSPRRDRKA